MKEHKRSPRPRRLRQLAFVLVGHAALALAAQRSFADAVGERTTAVPPKNFGFVYETGYGEKFDTFAGTMTKDLVEKPDTTIKLRLSRAELRTIYSEIVGNGIFGLVQPHPPFTPRCGRVPNTTHRFEITAGDSTYRFAWDDGNCTDSPEWISMYRVLSVIRSIYEYRPEYKRLPKPRAAYL